MHIRTFYISFSPSCFMSISASKYIILPGFMPLLYIFLRYLAVFNTRRLEFSSPKFDLCLLNLQIGLPLPDYFFRTHSSSLSSAPSLSSISILEILIMELFASSSASPTLSVRPCRFIPSVYKLLISFRLSLLQCRRLVYRCSTSCFSQTE